MKRIILLLALFLPLMFLGCTPDNLVEEDKSEQTGQTPDEGDSDQEDADGKEEQEKPEEGEGGEDPENPEQGPENPDQDPVDPPVTGTVELDKLYGYGKAATGGQGGKVHHFNDGNKFREWLKLREKNKSAEAAEVWLSGTFTKDNGRDSGSPWFDIKRTHNLTIIGTEGFRMQNVGFFLNEASNIIIRNIHIVQPKADNGADAISMQESHDIWVDHCTFESVNQTKDYEDGSCDVTHQTYNVTVSWCHFIKTQKSCLVGHSNSATADECITVTLHHNHFDNSSSRHPRVRFGRAHVYNNYFNGCTTYGVGSAYGAKVLVECNLFDGVRLPIDICTFPAKKSGSSWVSNLTGSVAGYVYERENQYLDKPSEATDPYPFTNLEYKAYNGEKLSAALTFDDFKPSYDYVVDEAGALSGIVTSSAGAGKLSVYAKAPVEVDNGGMGASEGEEGDGEGEEGTDPEPPAGEEMSNGWKSMACGDKTYEASVSGGKLTITAPGKFESGAQSFGYVYREVTGNFTATVNVVSFAPNKESNQGLAGILMTPDPSKTGTDLLHAMSGRSQNSFYYSYRLEAGTKASKGTLPETTGSGDVVMKLRREGDVCYTSYSLDGGATFGNEKKNTISGLPETVYVGLAVNSANNSATGTAVFSDFTLDGVAVAF